MLDFASPVFMSVMLMVASGAATSSAAMAQTRVQLAQVTIEQRVIIRIPMVPQQPNQPPSRPSRGPTGPAAAAMPLPPEGPGDDAVREVKGPKCIKLDQIRGAIVNTGKGVTMLTDKDEAFRAHFGKSCRPADFYAGFYVAPNKERTICAGRDALHARNGSTCDIVKFTKLVPDN